MSDDNDPAPLLRAAFEETLSNMSDNEFRALVARVRPPTDAASVRRSLAAAAKAMWETPRDHNGPTAAGSFGAAVAARQPASQPQQSGEIPHFQPPPDTGYTGSDSLRRTPFVTPVTTTTTHIR